jgi:hypothetical protein
MNNEPFSQSIVLQKPIWSDTDAVRERRTTIKQSSKKEAQLSTVEAPCMVPADRHEFGSASTEGVLIYSYEGGRFAPS